MPMLGLGTWELTERTSAVVLKALSLGYRMIDTAEDYGTQPAIGEAIRRSDLERGDVYLVTKVEEDQDPYEATQRNLAELGLDYSDLVLIHRPPPDGPGVELWERLIETRSHGIARDIGVSNYSIDQMRSLIDETDEVPAVNQIEWTPFGHAREMLEFCREHRIVLQAYSPLTRAERLDDDDLRRIAEHYDRTPAQVLLRWNLQMGTIPLPKAGHEDHLEDNIYVFDFEITESDMNALSELNEHYSALTSLQYL